MTDKEFQLYKAKIFDYLDEECLKSDALAMYLNIEVAKLINNTSEYKDIKALAREIKDRYNKEFNSGSEDNDVT